MTDFSVLAAKGAALEKNTPTSLLTDKKSSVMAQLAAGEKTQSMIEFEENLNKNNGGFFGGIGYLFEKIGLGFLGSIEGIWDYTAGGLAKLFGADDWAEQQFANDWVNYGHADERYNPSKGWQVAGDVAGGIGTSLPAIATVAAAGAIAYFSGGSLSPVAAGLISAAVAGFGAAGNATKEAYRQTGELGGKEFGYGALVGVTEGAVEGISAGIGAGTGQVVKNISKSFGKEIAETATRETLGKAVVKGFLGEAFEEGLSEILDPVWARLTYDPNAKNATFQEVGYAALIGGLSGAIMGGVYVSMRNIASTARGNTILTEGKANNVLNMAEQLNLYETTNKTGLEAFELVQNVYNELQTSLSKTNGQITTVKQKMLLGVLERANTTAIFSPIVARSAENIVNNADIIAERLTSYGYTDNNGKPITFTAEQIKQGIDINDSKSFSKALKTNDILRSLAVTDATGQITMNTAKFQEATLMGQKLSSQADLNRFIETATDSELQAVGEKLGINNWQSLTNAEFQEKITEFVRNDGVEAYKKERLIVKDAENVSIDSAKTLPKRLNMVEDGVVRYTKGDSQIAIIKDGDNYRIYDYSSKRLSKVLNKQEVNKVLRQLNTQTQTVAEEIRHQLEQESELRRQAAEIDSYARENIADYQKLNAANQSMVRAVIRQGRAAGIAEADVLSYARVSAHSGVNITFNKDLCIVAKTDTGENIYSDGFYDANNNRIVVNPDTKRTHEALLIHELDHAIRKTPDGGTIIEQGVKNMTKEEKEAIINRYRNAGRGSSIELIEEINAHYAEGMLTNKNLLEKLCETKPTLKEKILNFFKKSKSTYSEDVKLSKEAQSLYKRYKKLFDEFSARNQGNNAAEISAVNNASEAYALAKDGENDYNNEKGAQNGEKTENTITERDNVGNLQGRGRASQVSSIGDFSRDSQKARLESKADRLEYLKILKDGGHTQVGIDYVGVKNFISYLEVKENALLPILKDIRTENEKLGFKTKFTTSGFNVNGNTLNYDNALGLYAPVYDTIYIRLHADENLLLTNNHERMHNIEFRYPDIYKAFKTEVKQLFGVNYNSAVDMVAADWGMSEFSLNEKEFLSEFFAGGNRINFGEEIATKRKAIVEKYRKLLAKKGNLDNIRYALPETDSKGKKLTDNQRKYFAGSKVVDSKGKLLPVYHGSPYMFTEFQSKTSSAIPIYGRGHYFTTKRGTAKMYSGNNGSLYKVYLDIKNPYFAKSSDEYRLNSEKLIKQGYDGVIAEISDNETYFVVYDSNQIKETTNINPTINNDIRYALDSSKDIKDLVVVHNLSERKLLSAIELGGLAVPSIAITKTSVGHESFGDISLIFKSDTIDPKDSRNKVFESDVYSKRFPKVINKTNEKSMQAFSDRFQESADIFNDSARSYAEEMNENTKEFGFGTIDHKYWTKLQFLKERGIKIELPKTELKSAGGIDLQYVKEFAKKHPEIKSAYSLSTEEIDSYSTEAQELFDRYYEEKSIKYHTTLGFAAVDKFLAAVGKYNKNNEAFITLDGDRIIKDIDNAITKIGIDEYHKWVWSVIDEFYSDEKYFRNDLDFYDRNGEPRSFNQLYTPYTLENLVKYMSGTVRNTEGYHYGAGNIRSVMSKQYNSITEIKKDKHKILSTEEMAKLKEKTSDATYDLATKIVDETGGNADNRFEAIDITMELLADIAKTGISDNSIAKQFREYNYKAPSETLVKDIKNYLNGLKEVATEYFEAKPQRAVGFNEVVKVIAPVGTDPKILDYFKNLGISVDLYGENTNSRSEMIKSLPDNIRFALQEDEDSRVVGGLTKGQRAKFVANNTRFKTYSKLDATEVINSIIDERLVFDDKFGKLSGKSKAQVIDMLFTKLNGTAEGYRGTVALNIADYILENAVLEDMYGAADNTEQMRILSILRSYMHNINLSSIQGEIRHRYDNKNSINLIWGNNKSKNFPDTLAQELAEFGIHIDAINEADIFFQMVDMYESARDSVNKKVENVKLKTYGSSAKIEQLRQQIAKDILLAYDEKGEKSKYAKLVEKYTDKIANLTKQVKEADKKNKLANNVIDSAQYLRQVADKRSYVGAEVFNAPELTSWLKELGKLKYRSDLRKAGARTLLLNYGKFYNTSNPLLYDSDPNLNCIDENVIDALNVIKANENSLAPLSYEELQAAQVILASAKHLFQNYDQMIIEGKKVRISEAAASGITVLEQSKSRVGRGFFNNIYGMFNKIIEPRAVIKSLEGYNPDGILTRAYKQITDGETAAGLMYIDLVNDFDNFFKQNKKYKKRLTSDYIKVGDAELTVGQAISLYELSKREQAKEGLYESGFSYLDRKGKKLSVKITEQDIYKLSQSFVDSDKQFIAIIEEFFNVKSKTVKTNADLEILGYTNASDDFYFPIKRDSGTIARNVTDARSIMSDWANVYNFSFNKDVKAGSKNKLFISDVYSVVSRHAKQLSTYANLTVPLKNFSQLYAKNVGTKTDVKTIKNTVNEYVWDGTDKYLTKLFADIQGRATSDSFIEKLRGAYAKYQLGANLKVIVSQVTSYPTAGIMLDIDSMTKGAVMKTNYKALDEYCAYAKVRNYERGVVKAEGVIDKVGKVGDFLTKPIQWTDRLTIGKLWNACQYQIQKDNGYKVGTVENMKAAGVMLEEVIRLTQPNYTNTERSELMRSDSDIVRSFTMFTSVPLKQLSRLVESVGEFRALRQLIKSGNTSTEVAARYKIAKRKLGRTLASITVANLMYTMVGQFFKWLYNKDRKDKDGKEISFVQDLLNDFVSTNIGMFPVVKDIYNYFANDYEFTNFAYETIESVLSSSKELFELATKAANGEITDKSEYMRPLRNALYAIGQITGIPTRNINNLISGLMKRFDPATAYKYNSMFYNAKYSQDIKQALQNEDYKLANTIMSLMLNEDKAGDLNSEARNKLIELYEKEYNVLPKSVGKTITYNGEKIDLSKEQRAKFRKVYNEANKQIEAMILSKNFKSLSEQKQAKAIKQLYDAYYDKALCETLSIESDNKLLELSKYIDIANLSVAYAGMLEIQSDKDSKGNTISGSKKSKLIKYLLTQDFTDEQILLILAYQGYTIKDKEYKNMPLKQVRTRLLRYILGLKSTTQAEKAKLAEICGFEVRNGRIMIQTAYTVNK